MSHLNRKSILRIADKIGLLASCTAAGAIALKLGVVACGAGLLALGGAFLATDLWPLALELRRRTAPALPAARAYRRS